MSSSTSSAMVASKINTADEGASVTDGVTDGVTSSWEMYDLKSLLHTAVHDKRSCVLALGRCRCRVTDMISSGIRGELTT